jgi:similar to stage IV sporulation protein
MRSSWNQWCRGYVTITVDTSNPAAFLQILKTSGFHIWQVSIDEKQQMQLSISIVDYRRIRPVARRTSSSIKILRKHGLPFMIRRLSKRLLLISGFFIFILLLIIASSMVWRVEVSGNERYSSEQILLSARKQGVYPFQWKRNIRESTNIAKRLEKQLPGVSWIGVEIKGVVVSIRIVESNYAQQKKQPNGYHIVANKSAVISYLFAARGKRMVNVNDRVNVGDVLISGWTGSEEHSQLVRAEGIVRGYVWYNTHIKVPLQQRWKRMTGTQFQRKYIVIGSRAIMYEGYGELPFRKYIIDTKWRPIKFMGRALPVGWMHETLREIEYDVHLLTLKQAKWIAAEQAKLSMIGNRSLARQSELKVRRQLLQVVKQDKQNLYMKFFFEVEEPIATHTSE